MRKAVEPDFVWIKPDGRPTQYFSELLQSISKNSLSEPVSTTAPTNGQVMTYDATLKLWVPGAN